MKSHSSRRPGEVPQADLDFMVSSFGLLAPILVADDCDCFGPGGKEFIQSLARQVFERILLVKSRKAELRGPGGPDDEGGQSE